MDKNIILTGSLAFDSIFDVDGYFSDHIMPDKIHQINISIVTKNYKKAFGGTAATQAFYLRKLGTNPYILAVAGNDFLDFKSFLQNNKIDTKFISIVKDQPTASGFAITDKRDNQIWMFAPGAMRHASKLRLKRVLNNIPSPFVLISPNDLQAIINYVKESQRFKLEFAFDPSSYTTTISDEILKKGVSYAKIIFGNDYEIAFMEKRLNKKLSSILQENQILVKTLADQGSEIFYRGKWIKIGIYKTRTIDPTGAGDAYRAGFLYGYLNNKSLQTCGWMGAVTASFAVEVKGTMNLKFNKKEFERRLRKLTK